VFDKTPPTVVYNFVFFAFSNLYALYTVGNTYKRPLSWIIPFLFDTKTHESIGD